MLIEFHYFQSFVRTFENNPMPKSRMAPAYTLVLRLMQIPRSCIHLKPPSNAMATGHANARRVPGKHVLDNKDGKRAGFLEIGY